MAMFNPPHPGEVIRTENIEAHGLTVTAAAKVLGVSRQALLLNAQAGLTGDVALRLEKAFGPKMETLIQTLRRERLGTSGIDSLVSRPRDSLRFVRSAP